MNRLSFVSIAQGFYWSITGIWPLLHMPSFLWVTGPKMDLWLVRTVGVLILVVGVVLLKAGIARRVSPEIVWLGIGGAAGLMAIEVYYVWQNVIWPIYLLDAVVAMVLISLWFWASLARQ
jgi:hydrogenase/urease accessory protein HupE